MLLPTEHAADGLTMSVHTPPVTVTVSTVTQGAHMIEALNLLGVDAAVPGNHDFDVR